MAHSSSNCGSRGDGLRGWLRAEHLRGLPDLDRVEPYLRTVASEWLMLGLVLVGVWLAGSSVLTVLGDRWRSVGHFYGMLESDWSS